MSKIRLHGSSSGYVEIAPAAAASNNTLTAPSTVGEIIAKDAAGAIGVTSVRATNADFSGGTTRIGVGILSTSATVGAAVTITESGIEASGIGITCANINGNQIGGRRNMIINGDQRIAQRGTTAVLLNGNAVYRCVDRFKTDYDGSGGGNWYHGQTGAGTSITADVPTGQGFINSSKITVNTTASQPSGTDHHHQFYTMLERRDVSHLEWATSSAKTCTLSFWVKGSITGTYGFWIALYGSSGGSNYYYWTNYTIDSANTWEKKVITVTGPTSGGAITSTNDLGLRIEWLLGAGSDTETGTLNEWTTSNTIRTASGTVYLPENSGATWYITGIQFEVGSQATAFEHRSFNEELLLCKRYYQKSYAYETAPGTADSFLNQMIGRAYATVTNRMDLRTRFEVEMRTTPTLTTYTPSGGSTGDVEDYSSGTGTAAGTARDVAAVRNLGNKGFGGISVSPSQDGVLGVHYTADAEI